VSEMKLSAEEAEVLCMVLASVAVKQQTGELGIVHGVGRFVSNGRALRKEQRTALDAAAKKLGLSVGVKVYEGS
jgi:hypothetical protein